MNQDAHVVTGMVTTDEEYCLLHALEIYNNRPSTKAWSVKAVIVVSDAFFTDDI